MDCPAALRIGPGAKGAHHIGVIERRQRRSRRPAAVGPIPPGRDSVWAARLGWALVLVGLVSAFASVLSLAVVASAMASASPPQSPVEFIPVFAGSVIGLIADVLVVRGGLGMVRPEGRFSGGRGSAVAGLVLQLPAAVVVGALEASWIITAIYLVLMVGILVLLLRVTPQAQARPLARHPESPPTTARPRWTVQPGPEPIQWVGGEVPPPPSSWSADEEQLTPGRSRNGVRGRP